MSADLRLPTSDLHTPRRLPPTARDFYVYERVVIDLDTTRQAALDAGISQTRVRQVVRRVIDWLAESLPAETEASSAAWLRVAQQLAADRLERLYQDAERKWKATEQCRFASLALRINLAQSKLPVVAGAYEALMADALEGPEGEAPRGVGVPPATKAPATPTPIAEPETWNLKPETYPSAPPIEDCSAPQANSAPTAQTLPTPAAAPPFPPTTSVSLPSSTRAARAEFLSPAHLPIRDDDSSPITELKITPSTPGLTTHRPLSRKERRRRHRALAEK